VKRLSGGAWEKFSDLPPVGWAGGRRPHASRPLIGREAPIFQKFSKRYPFFKFNFFIPFLKKVEKKGSILHLSTIYKSTPQKTIYKRGERARDALYHNAELWRRLAVGERWQNGGGDEVVELGRRRWRRGLGLRGEGRRRGLRLRWDPAARGGALNRD
jgi:hypothetical protein